MKEHPKIMPWHSFPNQGQDESRVLIRHAGQGRLESAQTNGCRSSLYATAIGSAMTLRPDPVVKVPIKIQGNHKAKPSYCEHR